MIEQGKKVTIEYSLYDSENNLLDSSKGLGPLTFVMGAKQVLPALEVALAGLKAGDATRVELAAKDAYGPVFDTAYKEVPVSDLPEDCRSAGTVMGIPGDDGAVHQVKVQEINGDKAILDFNHPLAGQDIVFDILIIDCE